MGTTVANMFADAKTSQDKLAKPQDFLPFKVKSNEVLGNKMTEATAIVLKKLIKSGVIPMRINLAIARDLIPFKHVKV